MLNGTHDTYRACNTQPMSQAPVATSSPCTPSSTRRSTCFCDSPPTMRPSRSAPTISPPSPQYGDETIVLDGEMGEYCVTARRKGNDWYVGGITNWTPRDITDRPYLPSRRQLRGRVVCGRPQRPPWCHRLQTHRRARRQFQNHPSCTRRRFRSQNHQESNYESNIYYWRRGTAFLFSPPRHARQINLPASRM